VDLNPSGYTSSYATGISGSQQVGYGTSPDGNIHALLWSGTAASTMDLHSLLSTNYGMFSVAAGIDANGDIVGYAYNTSTGQYDAILWFTTVDICMSSSPANGGTTSGGGTYECGSNVTVCATANSCYGFVNWTDQNSNVVSTSACYSFTAMSNATLVASFAPIIYTIDTSSSPANGGTTSGGGAYECGSNVTVCATANSCYGFVNWTDQSSNVVSTSACYSFTAMSNATLVANFALSSGSTNGSLATLWSFTGGSDGASPAAGLVQGSDGNFYGTTSYGGTNGSNGTVFRITPSGSLTTLWSFTGGSDGGYPTAALVQGSDGNFYGTAPGGGASGAGTVFRITPSGSLTSLWSFTGGSDGASPAAGLVQGSDGNFYGTAPGGGASGTGTVFRITPSGSLTTLWSFTGGSDGASPAAGLVQGTDGNFYGTTSGSGSGPSANGTVFKLIISRTIDTSSSPSDDGTTSGGGTYECGSNVTVCATANSCYGFVNWTDQNSNVVRTSACYSFTVTGNATLVASFAPIIYTIDTSSSPSDDGTTSGGGTYECGSNVTVCATANSCYGFVNWTDQNSNVVSTSACYSFTAMSNATLVASFALVDSVGDGILDVWRQQYFGTGATTNSQSCATCDADGTGQNNLFKYTAGLDPTNPASVFILQIAGVTNQPAQENLLFNPVVTGRTYTPQYTTDLVSGVWSPLTTYTVLGTNGNQVTITDTNPIPPQEFYRIDISLP
jgi:uncharacterized repeat protein (TIGR03803 family)